MPATLDSAHQIVTDLIHNFQHNQAHFLSPKYQEAEARKDFIDKFFIALGWDVNHDAQTNPAEQEVKIERGVTVATMQKRADYAFYCAPNYRDVRFFVEAKKPSVDLNTNADAYFQTLRYGWNAQTPLAVLTDFEQFHILDCRAKPDIRNALARAHKTFRYTDFLDKEKFAEVYWLFSKQALAEGALDRYIAGLPKLKAAGKQMGLLRGSVQPVDASFLDELEQHREALAKSFKRDNPQLDGLALTEVTQRVLDRLVFLRFLEDKQIETEVSVANFARSAAPWAEFVDDSRKLNARYNGAVYKPHSLIDTRRLTVSDDDFRDVCEQLSDRHSPYDFNAIPIHILGSIYERFLGKVIVASDKRAKVEEKPEVRKAGGVYYTPEYIVRYIVDQTVGKLIEGKTPAEIAKLRFADIACGSGSFLLGVYDTLLRYHTRWFNEHPDKAERAGCVMTDDGAWRLSLQQRREMLINNVFGVDIDRQAVEVTQVSLYLKLLEDETTASSHQYEIQFHDTLLPNLGNNIKCGNSLIGTDILSGQMFTTDEERALNAMDFEDAFPAVMKAGGFDAIVGNPPYIFTRNEGFSPVQKRYFYINYQHQSSQLNAFGLFVEKSFHLLKKNGYFGVITPNNWLTIDTFAELRKFIIENTSELHIVNILDRVFQAANVDTAITIYQKANPSKIRLSEMQGERVIDTHTVDVESIQQPPYIFKITLLRNTENQKLLSKIEQVSSRLSELSVVSTGLKAYQIGKGKPKQSVAEKSSRVFHSTKQLNQTYKKYLEGVDVRRYLVAWSGQYLSYGDWLAEPRRSVPFDGERLLIRQIPTKPPYMLHGVLIEDEYLNDINSMVVFHSKSNVSLKYLLALLNSRMLSFWFQNTYDKLQRKIFPQFKVKELGSFPIRNINFDDPQDKAKHDRMVQLVTQMLDAKQRQAGAQSDHDRDYYEQRCAGLDRQIDALVYDLYGLTDDEIAIVEAGG